MSVNGFSFTVVKLNTTYFRIMSHTVKSHVKKNIALFVPFYMQINLGYNI